MVSWNGSQTGTTRRTTDSIVKSFRKGFCGFEAVERAANWRQESSGVAAFERWVAALR
jgi:hypothetical protein